MRVTREDPKTLPKTYPHTPALDADENPFLEKQTTPSRDGPILDISPDNPFLDEDIKLTRYSRPHYDMPLSLMTYSTTIATAKNLQFSLTPITSRS